MDTRKEKDINLITDLTLGLVDTLSSIPGVTDVTVGLRQGAEKATISAWEQRHGVNLPLGLKQLYLTTDGFSLTWNFVVGGKTLPLGNLEILPLSRLNRIGSGRSSGDVLTPSLADLALAEEVTPTTVNNTYSNVPQDIMTTGLCIGDTPHPSRMKSKIPVPSFHISKLFEIDNCKGHGKVVIGYPGRLETFAEASFWYIDLALRPHLLATDPILYWRMVLVYLGMPQWQSLAAGVGLTPWARQWYEILAPHILEGSIRQQRSSQPELINKLDWSVFKTKKLHKTKPTKEKESQSKAAKEFGSEITKAKENRGDKAKNQKDMQKENSKGNIIKFYS
ncbi:UNVERIFIED_CONTAM: hypothetical protein RMT77_017153 [Armadillidium vulgare]